VHGAALGLALGLSRESTGRNEDANLPIGADNPAQRGYFLAASSIVPMLYLYPNVRFLRTQRIDVSEGIRSSICTRRRNKSRRITHTFQ